MKYEIVKGLPTADEIAAIEVAMRVHESAALLPVSQKSRFGLPQLRRPLINSFIFGRKS